MLIGLENIETYKIEIKVLWHGSMLASLNNKSILKFAINFIPVLNRVYFKGGVNLRFINDTD